MSTSANWHFVGRIHANDRTAHLYKDTAHFYRVHDASGHIFALGYPTAGVTGDLISHERIAPMEIAREVGDRPFSKDVKQP